eukprot:PhF_6_TR30113/c0_g1_i4/m.43981
MGCGWSDLLLRGARSVCVVCSSTQRIVFVITISYVEHKRGDGLFAARQALHVSKIVTPVSHVVNGTLTIPCIAILGKFWDGTILSVDFGYTFGCFALLHIVSV